MWIKILLDRSKQICVILSLSFRFLVVNYVRGVSCVHRTNAPNASYRKGNRLGPPSTRKTYRAAVVLLLKMYRKINCIDDQQ